MAVFMFGLGFFVSLALLYVFAYFKIGKLEKEGLYSSARFDKKNQKWVIIGQWDRVSKYVENAKGRPGGIKYID